MKRSDILLLIAVFVYSFLFYYELPGLNYLIFSVVLTGMLLVKKPQLTRQPAWLFATFGTLLSATFVMLNASTIAIVSNFISLGVLSCLSVCKRSSVFVGLAFSIYSSMSSFVYMTIDAMRRVERIKQEPQKGKGALVKPFLILFPLLITVVFFLMYQESNPTYAEVTKDIKLDFLTGQWVAFTLFGFLLLYGFFYHRNFEPFASQDVLAPNKLNEAYLKPTFWDRFMTILNENFSGIVLLGLLNLVILSVNVVDVMFLYSGMELPEGVSRSASVHQGVDVLIISIILAISIILYYFRGRINFFGNNKAIKVLALMWVVQNMLMIFSTAMRNYDYILAHNLTFKRIGVYVWLLLTLIGLVVTFIKVLDKRSNWFLVRTCGWAFFVVLLASSTINWNRYISNYNIEAAEERNATLDVDYLVNLDYSNIPEMVEMLGTIEGEKADWFERDLYRKIRYFTKDYEGTTWRSWSLEKQHVYQFLQSQKENQEFVAFYERNSGIELYGFFGGRY